MAFFGEKYGERVRIVEVADFSLELCGGTHLSRTGQAGLFVVASESSIASGVRRVEALTGAAAVTYIRSQRALLEGASQALRSRPEELAATAERLRNDLKRKEREVADLRLKLATGGAAVAENESTFAIGEVIVWTPEPIRDYDKKQHRQFVDAFKEKHRADTWVAISTAVNGDKVSLIVEVSADLTSQIRADRLAKELAAMIDGRGGGKAERAEAGGRHPDRLRELLNKARELVRMSLEAQRA